MRLLDHADRSGERRRRGVAGVHLSGHSVQPVMLKREPKHLGDRFTREALPAMLGIEHPPDLRNPPLGIGEPQQHIPDRHAFVLDYQGERASTIDVGLHQSLRNMPGRVRRAPRFIQEIPGHVGSRVDAVQPDGILRLVRSQRQTVGDERQHNRGTDGHSINLT